MLEMKGITKVFSGVKALNQVDFEVRSGEVHALCGENGAGKTTLMKILAGLYVPDAGSIMLNGIEMNFKSPYMALDSGIAMIHQEMNLVQNMDVAENLWMGREKMFSKCGIINFTARYQATEQLFEELGIDLNPRKKIKELSIAAMQLVELTRAVSCHSDIIIMDEPTSALTESEIQILYRIVKELVSKHKAVIFISHKFEEIFEICDRVTVLRDGCYISTCECRDTCKDDLIKMVAGRNILRTAYRTGGKMGRQVLQVKNLNNPGVYEEVSFSVREGEVLGFSGLMGAGRTEIMRAVYGLDKAASGEIMVDGKKVQIHSPKAAVELGIGMVTEDRLRSGGIFTMSVMANATLPSLKKLTGRTQTFSLKKEKELFRQEASKVDIKYTSEDELIGNLSGGNQQKTIFARWLMTGPRILILDEPTRGIDVGTKSEIYSLIDKLAKQGMAILLVSSEMPELFAVCDRIMVVRQGRIVLEGESSTLSQEILMKHAFGI